MTQDLNLQSLRQAAEAATQGPWQICNHIDEDGFADIEAVNDNFYIRAQWGAMARLKKGQKKELIARMEANGDFLAAFDPTTCLALLDRLERAEADAKHYSMGADAEAKSADEWRERALRAEAAAGAVPEGLEFHGYSDTDEHSGPTMAEYIKDRNDMDGMLSMAIGDEFTVTAIYCRDEVWRVTDDVKLEAERVSPAAPPAQGLPAAPLVSPEEMAELLRMSESASPETLREAVKLAIKALTEIANAPPAAAPSEPCEWIGTVDEGGKTVTLRERLPDGMALFNAKYDAENNCMTVRAAPSEPVAVSESEQDLLDIVRSFCSTAKRLTELTPQQREHYPSPLSPMSPLLQAASAACVERGYTEWGLAIEGVKYPVATPPAQDAGTGDDLAATVRAHCNDLSDCAAILDEDGRFKNTATEIRVAVTELRRAIANSGRTE